MIIEESLWISGLAGFLLQIDGAVIFSDVAHWPAPLPLSAHLPADLPRCVLQIL